MSNLTIESAPDQATTYKALAAAFAEQVGAETFPVMGKQPALNYTWRACSMGLPGVHQANVMDVSGRRAWDLATGYGVAPCDGSRLAILDIDDPDHESARKARQIIGESLAVKRSTHLHIYIRLAAAMHKATFGLASFSLETLTQHEVMSLRGPGSYVVGPGSMHPSGERYEIANDSPVTELNDGQTRALFALFEQKPPFNPQKPGQSPDNGINPRLLDAIIDALTVFNGQPLRFSAAGTATLHNNPMRADDDNHSSFFSSKTGWIHDRLGDHWTITEVCNRFGINMRALGGLYGDKPQPKQLPAPAATQPTAPYESDLPARRLNFWRDGIPNLVRELLLNLDNETGLADQAPALLTWEVWNHAVRKSLISPLEPFAAARLVGLATDLGWDTSRHTIEKGLAQLCGWGILRRFRDDQSDMGGGRDNNDVPKTQQNSTGPGRKPNLYRFRKLKVALISIIEKVRLRIREWCLSAVPDQPAPEWFTVAGEFKADIVRDYDRQKVKAHEETARARALAKYERLAGAKAESLRLENLLQAVSTPLLPDRSYENTIQYRDNLYASKVAANPNRQISRTNAAKEVGRTSDTISAMSKRAGVERVPVYRYVELFPGNNLDDQILKAYRYAFQNAGVAMLATGPDGDISSSALGCPLDNPQYKLWAERTFTQGYRIFLRIQEASREIPTAPQKVESRRAAPGTSTKKHSDSGVVVVWRGYNPDYVKRQLAMRGLEETADGYGLRDLETGEVFSPDEP